MSDIKRICALCGSNRTLVNDGIAQINDRRGDALGLFGACCSGAVSRAVDKTPNPYRSLTRSQIREMVLRMARKELDINKKKV